MTRRERSLLGALDRLVSAYELLWGESTDYEQGKPNEAAYRNALRVLARYRQPTPPTAAERTPASTREG